jgi:hypothetical protein
MVLQELDGTLADHPGGPEDHDGDTHVVSVLIDYPDG